MDGGYEEKTITMAGPYQDLYIYLVEGLIKKKDRVIISGLMRSQYREAKAQLGRHDFHILCEWDYDMTWSTMLVENGKSK